MRPIPMLLCILLLMSFTSDFNTSGTTSKQILGTWQQCISLTMPLSTKSPEIFYKKVKKKDDLGERYAFRKNGIVVNSSTVGCGNCPMITKHYYGTWKQITDSTFSINIIYGESEISDTVKLTDNNQKLVFI